MNGKAAKIIRKAIYGDNSHRTRSYTRQGGSVVNTGLRRAYLKAKRTWKDRHR